MNGLFCVGARQVTDSRRPLLVHPVLFRLKVLQPRTSTVNLTLTLLTGQMTGQLISLTGITDSTLKAAPVVPGLC